jgi:hypothetical protein
VTQAQASPGTACALFEPAELMKLTGRKDVLGQGPEATETPASQRSECTFLEIHFSLTSTTPEVFRQTRAQQKRYTVQPLSGIGDEAYYMWDPRPGAYRNAGIVFRSGRKQLALGELTSSDSLESTKAMLLKVAKLVVPKVK